MGLVYKGDVLAKLRERGYNTSKLRQTKVLSESTIQKLRTGQGVSWTNLERLCALLGCQPGEIIGYEGAGEDAAQD